MKTFIFLSLAFALVAGAVRPGPKPLTEDEINRISKWSPEDKQAAWEMSGQFEGDMILMPDQRNGLINEYYRWPGKTIIYEFGPAVTAAERDLIRNSLAQYTANTCIQHREKQAGDVDFVYVTNDNSGCWSYVGRLGGGQGLNLQANGCMYPGIIVHEFMHALGFYHQHSATERDDYVYIMWENIEAGREDAFAKYGSDIITNYGTPYDFGSVMHYDAYAFSSNGQPTIITKNGESIGQREGLSAIDIQKLNAMYMC